MLAVYGRFFVGYAPSGTDLVYQYIPYQQLIRQSVHLGEWPMWNPMTFSGRPLMADIQVGVLYPPNWLHWIFPLPAGFTLLFLAHTAWSLFGCFRLGRLWSLSPPAAALMAVLYVFSGFLTAKLQSGIVLFHYVAAWLPWAAICVTMLARAPSLARVALLALVLALSLLAGSPQVTFYSWIVLVGLGLVVPVAGVHSRPGLGRLRLLALLAAAFALALLLTAMQTFQTYHMISNSFDRGQAPSWEYVTEGSLAPRLLTILINPAIFGLGDHADGLPYWGSHDFSEVASYITLWAWPLLIPLGALHLFRRRSMDARAETSLHGRLFVSALLLAIGAILLALGRHSPLYSLAYRFLPGFDRFRVPARLMFWFTIGVSVASAVSLDAWLKAPAEARRSAAARILLLIVPGAILLVLAGLYLARDALWSAWEAPVASMPEGPDRDFGASQYGALMLSQALRGGVFVVVAALALYQLARETAGVKGLAQWLPWALPALAALELALFAWPIQAVTPISRFARTHYPQTELVGKLRDLSHGGRVLWLDQLLDYRLDQNQPEVMRNALIMQAMSDARGYDPVNARWIGTWMNRLAGLPPEDNPRGFMFVPQVARPALLTLSGIEMILDYTDQSDLDGVELAGFVNFAEGSLGLWRNAAYRGLAFAVPMRGGPAGGDRAQAIVERRSASPGADPLASVVMDESILEAGLELSTEVDESFAVRAIEEGPNRYRYATDFPRPAALYFAMSAYPGWRVTVNGRPATPAVACGAFLAVAVDAGPSEVAWEYRPPRGYGGAVAASLAAVLFVAFVLVRSFVGRLRGRRSVAPGAGESPAP